MNKLITFKTKIMDSILKSISLRSIKDSKEATLTKKKFNLNEVEFLFTSQSRGRGNSSLNPNSISINKTSITIREKVLKTLNLDKDSSGALVTHNGQLCLITCQRREDGLFALTSAGKGRPNNLYIQIPIKNHKFIEQFKGNYVLENTQLVEGGLKISEMIKF